MTPYKDFPTHKIKIPKGIMSIEKNYEKEVYIPLNLHLQTTKRQTLKLRETN